MNLIVLAEAEQSIECCVRGLLKWDINKALDFSVPHSSYDCHIWRKEHGGNILRRLICQNVKTNCNLESTCITLKMCMNIIHGTIGYEGGHTYVDESHNPESIRYSGHHQSFYG